MECTYCKTEIAETTESQRYRLKKTGRVFCSPACGYAHRDAGRKAAKVVASVTATCCECGGEFEATGYRRAQFLKGGRTYCGTGCSNAYRARVSSETMAATNRKYASARMTERNPMHREEVRQKVSDSLQRIGHHPKQRGGNGRGPTEAETKLLEMLGPLGFTGQTVVPTGHRSFYPSHYKIDCGNPVLRIGVEADGPSHSLRSRRGQDEKKDAFLAGKGWRVFRFTNRVILETPETVLSTILRSMTSTPT